MLNPNGRLSAILHTIPQCNVLADVGCDHGKLVVAAVEKGICKKGIGIDISAASLEKAKSYVSEKGLDDSIKLIVSDGFRSLREKIDVAVIAGMGANEIIKIISENNIAKYYILCPHQDPELLREYINDKVTVIQDFIVKEKQKFYPIILAKNCKNMTNNYSFDEIILGKNKPESEYYVEKNIKRLEYLSNLFEKIDNTDKISDKTRNEYEALKRWQKSKI